MLWCLLALFEKLIQIYCLRAAFNAEAPNVGGYVLFEVRILSCDILMKGFSYSYVHVHNY